jgi:tripartite-type tricarboxylate transporter receptor subunit TctC
MKCFFYLNVGKILVQSKPPEFLSRVFYALMVVLWAIAPLSTQAQSAYPNKPIRIIIGYAPGASSDNVARIYGQKLSESWGQPVVNDFKPGGNTIIAAEALVRSAPDGYTFLLVLNTHAINPLLTTLPYDPVKDFAPVALLGLSEYMLAINPSIPAKDLKSFIAFARTKPGQLNYSSSGAGGLGHLSGELFNQIAGLKTQHIAFKGGAPSVVALISGEVQMCFIHPINVLSQIKAGKLRAMAISGAHRLLSLPEMPTFAEAGLAQFSSTNWFGILAPSATPKSIINAVSSELARIGGLPELKEKLAIQGVDSSHLDPERFAALIKTETEKFAAVVKKAHIQLVN